jgi:3-dehydroquinate synthase
MSKVEFLKKLPSEAKLSEILGAKPDKFLLIYDLQLEKNPEAKKWIKDFKFSYAVRGGEELKDIASVGDHIKKILKLVSPFSVRGLCIVAMGGGTVGDFAGFVASILKRGVPLIHVPTTLLAAMDSAHGGKTALNVGNFKNQVGTFYSADAVVIVRGLFEGLPKIQLQSAVGELAKMALIEGGELYQNLKSGVKFEMDFIWEQLPKAIEAKYRWVEKDPLEKNGERQVLNLGHSLGHVLESYYGLPHGIAVGQGLVFIVHWSHHQGYLSADFERDALDLLQINMGFLPPKEFAKKHRAMSRSRMMKLISEDKKLIDPRNLTLVLLENIGFPFRKKMTLESFLTETQRQGWTNL